MRIKAIERKWISIEEELPKPFETILMIYKSREIISGFMGENLAFYEFVLIDFITERVELNGLEPISVEFWMPFKNTIDEKILSICSGLSVYFKNKGDEDEQ